MNANTECVCGHDADEHGSVYPRLWNGKCSRCSCTGARVIPSAESRIAAALALHTPMYPEQNEWCICGEPWDTTADRCSSPTVNALLGEV